MKLCQRRCFITDETIISRRARDLWPPYFRSGKYFAAERQTNHLSECPVNNRIIHRMSTYNLSRINKQIIADGHFLPFIRFAAAPVVALPLFPSGVLKDSMT